MSHTTIERRMQFEPSQNGFQGLDSSWKFTKKFSNIIMFLTKRAFMNGNKRSVTQS